MSGDNTIVSFPRKTELPECPVTVEEKRGFCRHDRIRLVEHDRNVVCADCGAAIDAFTYLLHGAYAIRSAWQNHRMVEHKIEELQKTVGALEKEKRRLASAVKRLREKPQVDVLDVRKPL